MTMILFFGALFGFISVALGAYTKHAVYAQLNTDAISAISTALDYQLLHSLMICMIGFYMHHTNRYVATLRYGAIGFILGILCFSGSIYLTYLTDLPYAVSLAPIGGILLMVSWLIMAYSALILKRQDS